MIGTTIIFFFVGFICIVGIMLLVRMAIGVLADLFRGDE